MLVPRKHLHRATVHVRTRPVAHGATVRNSCPLDIFSSVGITGIGLDSTWAASRPKTMLGHHHHRHCIPDMTPKLSQRRWNPPTIGVNTACGARGVRMYTLVNVTMLQFSSPLLGIDASRFQHHLYCPVHSSQNMNLLYI